MAQFSCSMFLTAFFLFASGGGLIAILVLFWDDLLKGSTQNKNWFRSSNASSVDNVDSTAEVLFAGWIHITTILTASLTVIAGFWGFVCSFRRGQCETLSYLVLCVATTIFNVCLLVAASVVLAAHCHESTEKCMESMDKDYYIALFSIVGVTFFVVLISIFASCASCRDKCYCCGAADGHYEVDPNSYPLGATNYYNYN